jgi:hypothetical protein
VAQSVAARLTTFLATANRWSKAQRGDVVTLTDAATIAVDLSLGNNFTVTLGGNRTLGAPTNVVAGQSGMIEVVQDGTGTRTLSITSGNNYLTSGGVAITLSTAAGSKDYLPYYVNGASKVVLGFLKGAA